MVQNPFLDKSDEDAAKKVRIDQARKKGKKTKSSPFLNIGGAISTENKVQTTKLELGDEDEGTVKNFIVEVVKIFVLALIIIVPIRLFIFQPFFVQGDSMLPNFENAQYLIINEVGYKRTAIGPQEKPFFVSEPWKELERGEVVVFRAPGNSKEFYIKRVVGLPGESVAIENGKVRIANEDQPDGFYMDESVYLLPERRTFCGSGGDCSMITLDEEEYYVLGDNRGASNDSRSWGPLHQDEVIGAVAVRAWPVTKMQLY